MGRIGDLLRKSITGIAGGTVDIFGDASVIIKKATGILKRADDLSVGGLVEEVLQRVRRSPDLISPDTLLDTKLTRSILSAVIERVGSLPAIQAGVFSNDINAATLILIRDRAAELATFLVDLIEAAKCYALANALEGEVEDNDPHGRYNEYNEFDFTKPMNRHAAICQIQRLARSVIFILQKVAEPVKLQDINMTPETKLRSDYGTLSGGTITTKPAGGRSSGQDEMRKDEKWFFVNGIAGEQYWLRLACNKLKATFSRDITGIFNRGDGILWDIIECAGERSTYRPNEGPNVENIVKRQRILIQRTSSSLEAQKALKKELGEVLGMDDLPAHIVVIAHSQGCLLLRHVLEDLVRDATNDPKLGDTMSTRLCVFTFGNPSLHWKTDLIHPNQGPNEGQESKDPTFLSSHVYRTEHFANKGDIIAKLGVLSGNRPLESGYKKDEVFINNDKDWIGHLFGTQYSLDAGHYKDSNDQKSLLLTCKGGMSVEEANREFLSPVRQSFLRKD
ncbi:hypothetical protein B0I35DRAFT_488804 [Stachybotrys elegans]|uniref:DUF676 domain-containing protein n=1 Tax=Stachybotrys elegans TaxID=80388 RepID=A0A8K0WNJ2_9HYPO|nr:hypothetical protein B0I35DRAFT_488804 [Stachybotrys elegans]